jgi:CheY-like chemotaxis protein
LAWIAWSRLRKAEYKYTRLRRHNKRYRVTIARSRLAVVVFGTLGSPGVPFFVDEPNVLGYGKGMKNILIVEDDSLVGMMIDSMLSDLGYATYGPAINVSEALTIIAATPDISGAILDVNLTAKETSYPVAAELSKRNIPFVFATGYGAAGVIDQYAEVPVLEKPFNQASFMKISAEVFG